MPGLGETLSRLKRARSDVPAGGAGRMATVAAFGATGDFDLPSPCTGEAVKGTVDGL